MSRVKEALDRQGTLVMPGVYDALSARIAERAGFDVIFTTGYGISATFLGEPDFGILTQTEMLNTIYRICGAVRTPVIVDSDTGYGNAVNVVRTVNELMRAGAAGMFLEDQVWPKRCGHMRGKQVVPLDEYLKKLNAAAAARADGDLFIVARTDARQALGLEEAIRRGLAFKENGADAVFIEAPESREEMSEIARNIPGPLVANMIERGVTPLMTPAELRELGFTLIVWPVGPLYSAAMALQKYYSNLREKGTAKELMDGLLPFDDFHDIVGLEEKYALDEKYRT
ncbi:MAG: isocitrate lyase/PEP mutase family protein [Deltaproteobacteria bacterium]|nr:isocitrate lyase/PEP mutase family protein [Deltaproteobacteria bacterium]